MCISPRAFLVFTVAWVCYSQTVPVTYLPFTNTLEDQSASNLIPSDYIVGFCEDRHGNENYAVEFDGSSHFIEYSDQDVFDITGAITIETWVYVDPSHSENPITILSKPNGGEGAVAYALTSDDSVVHWLFKIGDYVFEFGSISPGAWTHLAVTFNHSLQRANCYQDGELWSTTPALLNDIPISDEPLIVGANWMHSHNFHGVIDDIRLFDTALDSTHIDSLYNIPFEPNAVLYPVSHNFGYVYIGYPDTLDACLINYSLQASGLSIHSIDLEDDQFTTNLEPTTVDPGSALSFRVIVDPLVSGMINTALTFQSNDSNGSPHRLELTGNVLPPPEALVTPVSIYESLYSGGEITLELLLENISPDGPLQYRTRILDSLGDSTVYFQKLDWVDWQDPENQDRVTPNVWITRDNYGGIFNALIESEYNEWQSPARTNWALGLRPQAEWHYTRWGALFGDDPQSVLLEPVNAYLEYDSLYLNFWWESFTDYGNGGGFSYTREMVVPSWIDYQWIAGILWSGQSRSQSIKLSAGRLPGGVHEVSIGFWLNDPELEYFNLPISLEVVEAPHVAVDPDSIIFRYAYIGYPDTIIAQVTNMGFGDLDISSIDIPGSDISIYPSTLSIEENSSAEIQIVFDPATVGDQSGYITIQSNDPDGAFFSLPLVANGVYPPDLVTGLQDIFITMVDESRLDTVLSITNSGSSDLQVSLIPLHDVEPGIQGGYVPDETELGTVWSQVMNDPVDPGVDLDLTSLLIGQTRDEVIFTVKGNEPLKTVGTGILMYFDTDRSSDTGWQGGVFPAWGLGADYMLDLFFPDVFISSSYDGGFEPTDLVPSALEYYDEDHTLTLRLPANIFGYREGWNFGTLSLGSGDIPDFIPDSGESYIHIPLPTNWIQLEPENLTISAGSSAEVTISLNSFLQEIGSHNTRLLIMSNDPEQRLTSIMISTQVVVGTEDTDAIPKRFILHTLYPNPFNPRVTIPFEVPRVSDISITVYDLLGRKVWQETRTQIAPGYHETVWNAVDALGEQLSSGLYLVRLSAPDYVGTRKVLLLR